VCFFAQFPPLSSLLPPVRACAPGGAAANWLNLDLPLSSVMSLLNKPNVMFVPHPCLYSCCSFLVVREKA
jgi:hypothetical protein